MNNNTRIIIDKMIESVELPVSAYEKAIKRYESLGKWFERDESTISVYDPHIYAQGSFRLGTAIRPLHGEEEYDLDLSCKLQENLDTTNITQEKLKNLVRNEIESYRRSKNIENKVEEKHRCLRLNYRDDLSFHMDIVPCIPATNDFKLTLSGMIKKAGTENTLADTISQYSALITDNRHPHYSELCDDWHISNTEGYAKWFEFKMKFQSNNHEFAKAAQVEDVPMFKRKTPLQKVVQILKRHRDNWSKNFPDSKPISVIITTLAANAYRGENNVYDALETVLNNMDNYINPTAPFVPNPVNPDEDFADRWYDPQDLHLQLKETFFYWLKQVKIDFDLIKKYEDADELSVFCNEKFSIQLNKDALTFLDRPAPAVARRETSINSITTPKPWLPE